MNAPSIDVSAMLQASSPTLGLTLGINMFVGREPIDPEETVTIFDTAAWAPQLSLTKDQGLENPCIQIRVRSLKYLDGWNLIDKIKKSLHGRANETWGGAFYTVIYVASGPGMLDYDGNNRPRFILNINLQRR